MSLQQTIKDEIKSAMLARDAIRLDVLRGISTAFMNELVKIGKKPQDELSDEEATAVIVRIAKQRKDSIEQFRSGGRDDLVKEEEAQYKVIEKYLPSMMEKSEVEKIAKMKKDELGITDVTKKGMLMSALMKDLKGKADGTVVKEVVDILF
jgi:uncharacterized protein YqeY